MTGMLRRAFRIIYDFRSDVSDLSDRLEKAEEKERQLGSLVADLYSEVESLREENKTLNAENENLRKALDAPDQEGD